MRIGAGEPRLLESERNMQVDLRWNAHEQACFSVEPMQYNLHSTSDGKRQLGCVTIFVTILLDSFSSAVASDAEMPVAEASHVRYVKPGSIEHARPRARVSAWRSSR